MSDSGVVTFSISHYAFLANGCRLAFYWLWLKTWQPCSRATHPSQRPADLFVQMAGVCKWLQMLEWISDRVKASGTNLTHGVSTLWIVRMRQSSERRCPSQPTHPCGAQRGCTWADFGGPPGLPNWDPANFVLSFHGGPTQMGLWWALDGLHIGPIWAIPCRAHRRLLTWVYDGHHIGPIWVIPCGAHGRLLTWVYDGHHIGPIWVIPCGAHRRLLTWVYDGPLTGSI